MRKRGGSFLQKAMAVLLSAVLCIGLALGTGLAKVEAAGTRTARISITVLNEDTEDAISSVELQLRGSTGIQTWTPSKSVQDGVVTYEVTGLQNNEEYWWLVSMGNFTQDGGLFQVPKDFDPLVTFCPIRFMDGDTVLCTRYAIQYQKMNYPIQTPEPKEGYTFSGWVTEKRGNTLFDFNQQITKPISLYASWINESIGVTQSAFRDKVHDIILYMSVSDDTTKEEFSNELKRLMDECYNIDSTVNVISFSFVRGESGNAAGFSYNVEVTYDNYYAFAGGYRVLNLPSGGGKGWTLDDAGILMITSQAGMEDWARNGKSQDNILSVKKVIIQNGVTSISGSAFQNCSNMVTVAIPDTVETIGNSSFAGAASLVEITLPQNMRGIGTMAFYGCSSLERVIMQGSAPPEVLDTAFDMCRFVTDQVGGIKVPRDSVDAYKDALGTYRAYVIEDFPAISADMLSTKLQEILEKLPVSNETTEDDVVSGIKKELDEYFKTGIAVQADNFRITKATNESDGLIFVELTVSDGGNSVKATGTKAIPRLPIAPNRGWTLDTAGNLIITSQAGMDDWIQNGRTEENLQDVKNVLIQDGVTAIPDNAFKDCVDIRTVTVSESVKAIGNGAFSGCSSLEKVVMQGSTPPTIGNSVFEGCKFVTDSVEGIVVPPGTAEEYNKAAGGAWGAYIAGGSPTVTDAALSSKLKEVFEGLSVSNDVKLETVRDAVKEAIDAHFRINSVITIAGFEISNATIENEGFLKLIVTVRDEESSSFAQAEGIIPIPKLPPLPDRGWTLDEAGNLVIGSQAGMDDWASSGRAEGKFPAVKNVSIQSGVTSIPDDAFSGCCDLEVIVIPDTVTSIGSLAFKHASSLSEIILPPNLQSIGDSAFSDCSSLEKVVMQGNMPPSLGATVFDQCKFVTDSSRGIVVPKGTEDAYKAAWGSLEANILGKHTHSYAAEWTYDETDHWHECACGVKGDMAAHAWDRGTVTKEPTEVEPGAMNYLCSVCGMEKTESIPATGGGGDQDGTGNGDQDGTDDGTPSVSGNDNQSGDSNGSVSGNDNPGGGNTSVSGNDNPGGDSVGDSPSIPQGSDQGGRSGGGDSQLSEDNSSDLALLWNTLTANAPKDAEPRTADGVPLELYATVAMIAGFFYLLLLFLDKYDITEEKRRESLARLVRWAKCGGWLRKLPVMAVLLLMRTYYRIVGGQQSKEKKI